MSGYGDIIFLNGLTSSGKTSIIRELVDNRKQLFFVLGFDLFEETVPEWCGGNNIYYANAIIAMYEAAKSLSRQGRTVLIDGLIMNFEGLERHYEQLIKSFNGYPLKIVEVYCPLEILRERNIARGDRQENQSLEQDKIAEKNIDYRFKLDTSKNTPAECADLLINKLKKPEMRILETERLYLREFTLDDRDELARVLSNPESMRFYPHPFSDDEVENWIKWNLDNYQKYKHGLWAVILKENDTFIGDCGITMQNIGDGEVVPEIGFHIIPEYCRNGYASEAALACKEYAFKTLKYKRIFSYTRIKNLPSQGVAKKIGLKFYKSFEKGGAEQVAQYADNPYSE